MSNGLQPHFTREYLHIKPVQQAPNPFIPNEADRIFVPKDDPVIKFARNLQAYNPNLKDWADREEGKLMEEGKKQAMDVWLANGGDQKMIAEYLARPGLDGVNPYLRREIGKEALRRKSVEYNAAMKFAYDENGWSNLEPDEFFKTAQEFEKTWLADNKGELSMVDSRDMPEIFGELSKATLKVVSQGYYEDKATAVRAKRDESFDQRIQTEVRHTLGLAIESKDYDYSNFVTDYNLPEEEDHKKYDKVKAFLKDSDIHKEIVKTVDHYRENLNMSKQHAYTLSLKTLRNMALTDDGNKDAYIALASLQRDGGDEFDAEGNIIGAVMDKAEFAAWAQETEKMATIAYQDRRLANAKRAAADEANERLEIDKKFNELAPKGGLLDVTVEKFIENNNFPLSQSAYVNSMFTAYANAHTAPIVPKSDEQQYNYNNVLHGIHTGQITSTQQLLTEANAKRIFAQDFPSLLREFTSMREKGGGISEEGSLVLNAEPQAARMIKNILGGSPVAAENALGEANSMLYDFISEYEAKNGRKPTNREIKGQLPEIVNQAVTTFKKDDAVYFNTDQRRKERFLAISKLVTSTITQEQLKLYQENPEALRSFAIEATSEYNIPDLSLDEQLTLAVQAAIRGHNQTVAQEKATAEKKQQETAKRDSERQAVVDYFSNPEVQDGFKQLYPTDWEARLRNMGVPIITKQEENKYE